MGLLQVRSLRKHSNLEDYERAMGYSTIATVDSLGGRFCATPNPLPLIINPPTPLIIKTPQIWYTIIYWEYLLLGAWGALLLGGGDYAACEKDFEPV